LKNKYLHIGIGLLLTVFVINSYATDIKIGFVNPVKILETAPQVKAANARLEREFAPEERKINQKQNALRKLEDKLSKNSSILSENELSRLNNKIVKSKRELRRAQEEFREDYNIKRSAELDKLQKKIYDAIKLLAKEEGYDLIVSDGVIVASKKVDITVQVLARLKKMK
jgi:outer membrane protein